MKLIHTGLAAGAALAIVGCATDPNTGQRIYGNTAKGTAAGAIIGAGLGTLAGGDDGRNAAIGAAVGAIAGGSVGVYMDKQEAEMRRRTAGTGIEVERVGDQLALTMPSDVTFPVDSSTIQTEFYSPLDEVAATLKEFPSTAVDIIGHADSTGADDYNMELSERRAMAVRSYLERQDVRSVRIAAAGMGESRPVASNDTAQGRAQNRRVEIILTPIVDDPQAVQ